MGDLTHNFSRHEFACKCGCGFDDVDDNLVIVLQLIRETANMPIYILSGCRCPPHNIAVRGMIDSYHKSGKAADWRIPGLCTFELYLLAIMHPAYKLCGIGLYPGSDSIHTDIRLQPHRWGFVDNNTVSFNHALLKSRHLWYIKRNLNPSPEVPT